MRIYISRHEVCGTLEAMKLAEKRNQNKEVISAVSYSYYYHVYMRIVKNPKKVKEIKRDSFNWLKWIPIYE